MNNYKEIWNKKRKTQIINSVDDIKTDSWLDKYDYIINEVDSDILDLGCGKGNNTISLLHKGKKVISCDYSEEALKIINTYIVGSKSKLFDLTEIFPFPNNFTDLILADLCLHYFTKEQTINIINEIKRVLRANGYLLFRVNSTSDKN